MIPRTEHASLPKKVLWVILIPVTKINWAVGHEIPVKSPDQAVSVALDGGRDKASPRSRRRFCSISSSGRGRWNKPREASPKVYFVRQDEGRGGDGGDGFGLCTVCCYAR